MIPIKVEKRNQVLTYHMFFGLKYWDDVSSFLMARAVLGRKCFPVVDRGTVQRADSPLRQEQKNERSDVQTG
jgi:hypothetical protein